MTDTKQEKNVLVIGNGFDLYHCLPTRYIDFINVVNRLLELADEQRLQRCSYINYMFGTGSPLYSDEHIKKCYQIHSNSMRNVELKQERIERLVEISKENVWIKYFLKMCTRNIGWIDFEKEMAQVINAITNYFDCVSRDEKNFLQKGIHIDENVLSRSDIDILMRVPFYEELEEKLEGTINQLRSTNIELERDIERKSKIDEMRKSFISDVSHELKTPIALIQGYSEGLLENVNTDEESRKFYAEVILDEATKMDKMVRQLIELTKLEYENREFNNRNFNIVELEKEICRSSKVMIEEKGANVEFETADVINVYADDFYISQCITNYLTNAIKHVEEVDGEKTIKITNTINNDKARITIFNTGKNIEEENLSRIWNRFFKVDESRNREDGGSGIGLSIVRAIMNNYGNDFGVENKPNGVEFYFDIDLERKDKN